MDTAVSMRIHGQGAGCAYRKVKSELKRLEKLLSRFIYNSDISRINQAAGKSCVKISPETCGILSEAVRLSVITGGLFDITIAPLVDLWNVKKSHCAPDEVDIRNTLSYVNYRDIIIDTDKGTAALNRPGQAIDLGGIGKGYAGDRCMKLLEENGIASAFVSIGGNVSTLGNNPNGHSWRVGIRHPRELNSLIGAVTVTGKSVVTSGDYERYFIDRDGIRRHHILSPITGYPVDSGLISVTVIHDNALTADALSTAIFTGGIEKGLGCLAHYKGAEAVLVDKDLRIYVTEGIRDYFITKLTYSKLG